MTRFMSHLAYNSWITLFHSFHVKIFCYEFCLAVIAPCNPEVVLRVESIIISISLHCRLLLFFVTLSLSLTNKSDVTSVLIKCAIHGTTKN